jgi:hypothetical protein
LELEKHDGSREELECVSVERAGLMQFGQNNHNALTKAPKARNVKAWANGPGKHAKDSKR